jgi:RNA polymerase sigma-70 factor (ECF subfamily)
MENIAAIEPSRPAASQANAFGEADFERMRKQTERRAYSMAVRLTGNPVEAEDLMQETYVKAWRGFEGYMPDRPFLNWILRIMQRAYLDMRRRSNPVRDAGSLLAMVSPKDGTLQEIEIADPSADAEDMMLHEEFISELRGALAELPAVYRRAIELRDLEGLTYEEIALQQGTTVGTVRSRIHRGRKILRGLAQSRGIVPPSR